MIESITRAYFRMYLALDDSATIARVDYADYVLQTFRLER